MESTETTPSTTLTAAGAAVDGPARAGSAAADDPAQTSKGTRTSEIVAPGAPGTRSDPLALSESILGGRPPRRRPWWGVPIPWTMYRYLSAEILRIFVLAIVAVSLLYTIAAAYQTVRNGLQLSLIWPLLTKTFAYPLYYSVPISFLFATTLALGRMSNDLEISALRTHGFSHLQIYAPVMGVGALLCGLSLYITGWVVPEIHYEKRNLQAYILEQLESLGSGQNRTLMLPDGAGVLWVGAYDGTNLWRVEIDLHLHGNRDLFPELRNHLPSQLPSKVKIFAREGSLELTSDRTAMILNLRGVDVLVPETVRTATVANERFHQRLSISENVVIPLSFAPKNPGIKDRTQPELLVYIEELREELHRLEMFEHQNLAYVSHASGEAPGHAEESQGRVDRGEGATVGTPVPAIERGETSSRQGPDSSKGTERSVTEPGVTERGVTERGVTERGVTEPSVTGASVAAETSESAATWRQKTRGRLERRVAQARTEFHRRLSFSLSCLTFPLVAVSVTLLLQRFTRLLPFCLASAVVIGVYYPLLTVGVSLGEGDFVPPLAMALPNLALLALGVYLTRKVLRQ